MTKKIHAIQTILFIAFCFAAHAQAPTEAVKAYLNQARKQSNSPSCLPILFTADSLAKASNDTAGRAAVYDQLSLFYYNRDANKCIMYLQKARNFYKEANNKKRAALCLHNIAFAYEDREKNTTEALKYTRLAIKEQTALNDTMQQANMYKYMGMLQGKLHQFEDAKKSISISISLFSSKNYPMGIAVAYRDLASVYEEEHLSDSCIAYLDRAKNMWKGFGDTSRIFNLNNSLLRIYTSANRLQSAGDIFNENKTMLAVKAVYFKDEAEFYSSGSKLFIKEKNDDLANVYSRKYAMMRDSLKQKGIIID